jgi:uncharacterized protein (TIGR03790 family)
MRTLAVFLLLLAGLATAAPDPESVAILYNSAVPESLKLAETYQRARNIPAANLVGLRMPVTADISRAVYDTTILKPLRAEFEKRRWWRRAKDQGGLTVPVSNRIGVLVTLKGVPLRIRQTPPPPAPPAKAGKPVKPEPPKDPVAGHDEASVDSELALFGVENLPAEGVLQNKFYQSSKPFKDANMPFLVLTARIDAASFATCERMIRDAVEVGKSGLWGMAVVDIANKFPQGDQWLEAVAKENIRAGIPTLVDRFNDTLPKNYPVNGLAQYFGWYDWNVSGPFLNPSFRFRKGAVAMHLHSFSAEQLSNAGKNWCAPLLERGAAVTVGNVFEPYLHLTHDFGMLHQRLLAGHSWVEACWMAMPVVSWQGVVLGDPLYQPFKHLAGTGEATNEDRDYRAVRAATLQWSGDAGERRTQLDKAAVRMKSGLLAESAALDSLHGGLVDQAKTRFLAARAFYAAPADQLRQDFHLIAMDRAAGRKVLAIEALRAATGRYAGIQELEAIKGWLDILDPPPPPPAAGSNKKPPVPTAKKP